MPALRFRGFYDAWEQRKFSEILEYSISNNTLSRANLNYDEGAVKNIHYGDILVKFGSIVDVNQPNVPYVTNGKPSDFTSQLLQNGDVIVADTAEDETTGKAIEVTGITDNYAVSGLHTMVARPNVEFARKYLGYYLNSPSYHNALLPLMQGIKVLSLSKANIAKTVVRFPKDVKEQANIGIFFKQLDNLITQNEHKLNLLKQLKQAYLQKIFSQELRFAGFSGTWEQRKLGKIGNTFNGLTGKTKEDFGHGDAKFVTYLNVFQNELATLKQLDSVEIDERQNQVQKGDVFFTTSSETPEEVGMSSVWTYDIKNIYLNSFTFGYRPTVELDLEYLATMLRSPSVRKKITFLAQGISRYNISKSKMMKIEVPIPNIFEQENIGSLFKQLDNLITLNQQKVNLLKKQKQAYLQKMFN